LDKPELKPFEKLKGILGKTSSAPDVATAFEIQKYTLQSLEIRDRSQNIALRKIFAWCLFAVLIFWLSVVIYIVIASGSSCLIIFSSAIAFHLSDSVIIALLTTTTANVIGFFYVVTNYLFPKTEKAEEKK
jgi:CHASE2 domain-containing sensor protein